MTGEDRAVLQVRNVSMQFGGVKALDDVSLSVAVGEVRGIIGPNGSGKTTLLNVISGIYRPVSGSVLVAGRDVTAARPWSPSRLPVARTFQSPQSAPLLTLTEATMMGLDARRFRRRRLDPVEHALPAAERARETLEWLGCARYADTLVAEVPYSTRRLAELGSALLCDPDVLLLDEPAAGMNADERQELVGHIREAKIRLPETSIVLIEHDLVFVGALCQRLVALDFGRVVDDGPLDDVLGGDAVLSSFLGGSSRAAGQ
jgi:ABC-type branched-subunit amino acid transport system ATPase component